MGLEAVPLKQQQDTLNTETGPAHRQSLERVKPEWKLDTSRGATAQLFQTHHRQPGFTSGLKNHTPLTHMEDTGEYSWMKSCPM